jgi:transaldolase
MYDAQMMELAARDADLHDAIKKLTTDDVRNACDVMAASYAATNGVDGRVSIEVDPDLADETEATTAQATDLWKVVDRPNVLIKIPATKAGLPSIAAVTGEGVSVNVTLIFALERYREVINAYMTGLEQAADAGHDLSKIQSVASFFVSRVDTEIDKRLEAIGSDEALALRGKAAIANARLAFQAYEQVFATERWTALADAGAKPQRPLWASTGVKDPAYDDTMYVIDLVTRGVVNTMPEATLDAVADHGAVRGDTIRGEYASAAATMTALAEVGIDMADVVDVLEVEAVEKFETSWNDLLKSTQGELERLAKADSQ